MRRDRTTNQVIGGRPCGEKKALHDGNTRHSEGRPARIALSRATRTTGSKILKFLG